MRHGRTGCVPVPKRDRGRGRARVCALLHATGAAHPAGRFGAALLGLSLLGGLGAVGGCILGVDGLGETGTGAGGAGASAGSGGAVGECQTAEDCPGQDTSCSERACIDHACLTIDAPLLTACTEDGGHVCDGDGRCLLALGDPCESAAQCLSGHCADATCCTTACEGGCERCEGTNPPGTCLPYTGSDPEGVCGSDGVCDGSGGCARGELLWQTQLGGAGAYVEAWGVAADQAGNVLVAGVFDGVVDFGAEELSSAGDGDGFLVKLDPDGAVLWARQLGDDLSSDSQRALDVAVAPDGAIVVVGDFATEVRLGSGGGLLASVGGTDGFVASFTADGAFDWGHSLGGDDDDHARRVAVGPAGEVLVFGQFRSETMAVGASTLTNAGASATDFFLASFTDDGQDVWAHAYGDAEDQCPVDLACGDVTVGTDGSILLSGSAIGRLDLGGDSLGDDSGLYSAFVGQLHADGTHRWSQGFANGVDHQGALGVAFESPERAWITGSYWGELPLGGDCDLPTAEGSGSDLYFASFDLDPTGSCEDAVAFAAASDQVGFFAETDSLGNLAVAGRYEGEPNVDGVVWPWAAIDSAFVLKRAANGAPLWSHGFASGNRQDARDLAVRPDRSIVVAGYFEWSITIGSPMTSLGVTDAFVVAFEP